MFIIKRSSFFRLSAAFLAFIMVVSMSNFVNADAITPRASDYLDSYNTYIYNAALGKIRVYFDVTGVNYMDEIGLLHIKIYESSDNENWTWVKTYRHDSTTGMLGYNEIYHSGYVEYSGTIGKYYKAYVTIWAGNNGSGDTRYLWTHAHKATLFAG